MLSELSDFAFHRLVLLARSTNVMLDAFSPWLMLSATGSHLLPEAHETCQNVPSISNIDVTKSIHTRHELCVHAFYDVVCHCLMTLSRCAQTTSDA